MTMFEDIRKSITAFVAQVHGRRHFSIYEWFSEFVYDKREANKVLFYPQVPEPDLDDDPLPAGVRKQFYEDLDMENLEILDVKENVITFCAGGDWQNPLVVDFVFDPVTEIYTCKVVRDADGNDFSNGMADEDFIDKLGMESEDVTPDGKLNAPFHKAGGEKITSADCVAYIVNYYKNQRLPSISPLLDEKNWKRKSKRGSRMIYREFRNTQTGTTVMVEATEDTITSIYEP